MSNQENSKQIKDEKRERRQKRRADAINFFTNLTDADKQRFVTFLGYAVILLIAVLSSYLQVAFGMGEDFKVSVFVTNLCFNIVIGVLALMLSLKDGRLSNETRKRGELYETKKEFKQKSSQIVDTDALRQWNDKTYETQRLDYIMKQMAKVNIFDCEYLYITDEELKSLLDKPDEFIIKKDGKETVCQLDQIDDYQYDTISYYRSGKFQYKKLSYSFFKTSSGRDDYKYYADNEGREQNVEIFAYVYRIAMIVIFSVIISFSIVNPTGSSGKQVAFDTASRVGNAIISLFMGYSLAHDEMRRLINSLTFKIEKIDDFLTDIESGRFVPVNRSELVAQKIKEIREKKKAEICEPEQEVAKIPMLENKAISVAENEQEHPAEPKDTEEVVVEMTEEQLKQFIEKQC